MGSPSDDDVPTMTSSADLRRENGRGDDESGADAEDRTLQKPPDAVAAIETGALGGAAAPATIDDGDAGDATVMSKAPKPTPPKPQRPALDTAPKDKLPPPPSNPLRPRLSSQPSATGANVLPPMRARAMTVPGLGFDPPSTPLVTTAKVVTDAKAKTDENEVERPPTLESEPPPSEPATSPKVAGVTNDAKESKAAKEAKHANAKEGEPSDDSITATAPRVPAPMIPLSPPRQVEIRTLGDDDDDGADETEVRTLAADVGDLVRAARADASADASAEKNEADAADDSVTAQAPVAPVPPMAPAPPGAAAEAAKVASKRAGSSPVIRISGKSLMPAERAKRAPGAYDAEEEDSVTERGLPVGAEYPDDSVTAQAPSASASGVPLPAPIDGETEGTTKRVKKKGGAKHAAEDEQDSITAAAPGHLTNMLRVIASPTDAEAASDDEDDDDEDALQAHTQVMMNAPVKPIDYAPRSGAAAAPRLEPSSESGLRVASSPDVNGFGGGERASLGALGVPNMRAPIASDPALAMGPSPSDRISRAPFGHVAMAAEAEKKPPYALLVGVVAIISIAIPVMLFFILRDSGGEVAPRILSQPVADPVGVTGSRPRAKPSPSTSNRGPTAPNRGPIRR